MDSIRHALQAVYLDWFNNYLTIEVFAEHKGISIETAKELISCGKSAHENLVKEQREHTKC